ncbi:hypothetical protein [Gallaecimonas sp. GXIMD4217]|uniref:hypothetical protein n=1 Tax=Gallaecimonas sp. GXIMD4217 TaxID=3131927 RepID=UPI00311B2337
MSTAKQHPLLSLAANLMVIAGFIGAFMPELLLQFLGEGVQPLLVLAWPLFIGGIALGVWAVMLRRQRRRELLNDSRRPARHEAVAERLDQELDWTPLVRGGANFQTKKLVALANGNLQVKASWKMVLFGALFMAMGGGIGGFIAYQMHLSGEGAALLFPLGLGLVFVAVGGGIIYFASRKAVFDRRRRLYYKGDANRPKESARFDDIKALQILAERCTSTDSDGHRSSYTSYELNLVLPEGRRLNVMDHGNLERLHEDARRLAELLKVPVVSR